MVARSGDAAKQHACSSRCLAQVRPDALLDEMDKIVEYMLACAASDDEQLALEACEFWSTFAESAIAKGMLRPILGPLMPVLLKNMVYSEFDKARSVRAPLRSFSWWLGERMGGDYSLFLVGGVLVKLGCCSCCCFSC